jgi:hypothetical protein
MRPFRRSLQPALALGAVLWLPLRGLADERLAGYWVPATGEFEVAAFSISLLGKWTIVAPRWDGSVPDAKVRYTVVTSGNTGTLNADEKLDRLPDAPHTMTYEIQGGELFLAIPDTAHAGKYHLVKGVPPSTPAALAPVAPPAPRPGPPGPPRPRPAPAISPNAILGKWTTEPEAPVQVNLTIVQTGAASVKITQMWIKGSDAPVTSRAADYAATFNGNGGSLSRDKPDFEGSPIPLRMYYGFAGDALMITVDDGNFTGQYRLVRKLK